MLEDEPETSEGGRTAAIARAMVKGIDAVLAAMPEVDPESGDFTK